MLMEITPKNAFAKEFLLQRNGHTPTFVDNQTAISLTKILSPALKEKLPVVDGNKQGILKAYNTLWPAKKKMLPGSSM